jgi:hypothetical protein
MGLLDDAIREHLELKRRHGADPAEVAAQEREVLGAGGDAAPSDAATPPADAVEEAAPPPADPVAAQVPDAPPAEPAPAERFAPDPDLDWTEPAPVRDPEPEAAADEPDDVLEETPEFLEETPEHDRLWFEQRPPRDFDF